MYVSFFFFFNVLDQPFCVIANRNIYISYTLTPLCVSVCVSDVIRRPYASCLEWLIALYMDDMVRLYRLH